MAAVEQIPETGSVAVTELASSTKSPTEDPGANPVSPPSCQHLFASFSHTSPLRFFLDLCSGSTKPLSTALAEADRVACPNDILLFAEHDLLDDVFFEQLLRICGSGLCSGFPSLHRVFSFEKLARGALSSSHLRASPRGTPTVRFRECSLAIKSDTAGKMRAMLRNHLCLWRTWPF